VIAPRRLFVATIGLTLLVAACSSSGASPLPSSSVEPSTGSAACPTSQPEPLPAGETRTVSVETDKGTFAVKVDGNLSPIAAGNFVALAECGYYDGVVFHRVVPGFVIQGGDPTGTGSGGPGYQFQDEFTSLKHDTGVISMANAGPGTNGSQFFITFAPQPHLDGKHTVFGRVTSGMDAVNAIRQGDTILAVSITES